MSETGHEDDDILQPEPDETGGAGALQPCYVPLKEGDVSAEVFTYIGGLDAPRKMMVAKGLAPLKPAQLVLFTYMLIGDQDEAIARTARESFAKLPPGVAASVLTGNAPHKLLDYAAHVWYANGNYLEALQKIALNRNTNEFTHEFLIKHARGEIVDIIANNQTLLMAKPQLIYAFALNPNVSIATVSLVLEFARRQHLIAAKDEQTIIDRLVGTKSAVTPEAPEEERKEELPKDEAGEPLFPEALLEDRDGGTVQDAVEERQREERGEVKPAEEIEEEIKKKLDVRETIKRMTVSERLRLAKRGNMEARGILIFDSVPIVAKAVLDSPRLTKIEVERWSAMKILDTEILEVIGKDADFLKSYAVRMNLVVNPRTPISIAIKLMGTLMEKDIKTISKSKAVPQSIANVARQKMSNQAARRGK